MINLRSKTVSPVKFLIFTTVYLVLSMVAFLLPGDYSRVFFVIVVGSFYLFVWLFITLTCAISKQVRYSPILTYPILFIQVIATLSIIPDAGLETFGCNSKNFIQSFFERAESCSGQWINDRIHLQIVFLYMFLVTIFTIDIIRLKFASDED